MTSGDISYSCGTPFASKRNVKRKKKNQKIECVTSSNFGLLCYQSLLTLERCETGDHLEGTVFVIVLAGADSKDTCLNGFVSVGES